MSKFKEAWDKFFKIEPLEKKEKEFLGELETFLEKNNKSLKNCSKEERDFILKIGSAIYSTPANGFCKNYLEREFWREFGQYMNGGKGYAFPEDPFEMTRKIKELDILKVRKCRAYKTIVLTEEFLKMRECDFWDKEYTPLSGN